MSSAESILVTVDREIPPETVTQGFLQARRHQLFVLLPQ